MKLKLSIIFILLLQFTPVLAKNTDDELANKIIEILTRVAGKEKIGAKLNPVWENNIEVQKVLAFSDMKRNAIIAMAMDHLEKNEIKIIPEIKNDNDVTVLIILRLKTHQYFTKLIPPGENKDIIRNYFDNEISDLKLIISGKQDYGSMYINAHKARLEKMQLLLFTNPKVVEEFILLEDEKSKIDQSLANKATFLSLVSVCKIKNEFCMNL